MSWKLLALAIGMLAVQGGLSGDGSKYLAEAKKRIARIEKSVTADAKDVEKARADVDDLLASKRFLDNVQKEQPKNGEAAALQKKADALLKRLEPTLLKQAIVERLDDVDQVIASIEKDLSVAKRDTVADESLRGRFDMLRDMVKDVLVKDPANTRAKAAADKENELWQKYRAQREGVKP